MIFEELVAEVCERLNLSSDESKSRVGREINNRYRQVTSSIGLATSRFTQVSKTATIGNSVLVFAGIQKILAVIDKTSGKDWVLKEITPDEMHIQPTRNQPPRFYSIQTIGNNSVTIKMDVVPTTTFLLYADGLANLSTLSGGSAPNFPEDFHDILIHGVMADEYRKMEKLPYAKEAETDYERRLSDLRMFIAKSAYLNQYQGKYGFESGVSSRYNAFLGE